MRRKKSSFLASDESDDPTYAQSEGEADEDEGMKFGYVGCSVIECWEDGHLTYMRERRLIPR